MPIIIGKKRDQIDSIDDELAEAFGQLEDSQAYLVEVIKEAFNTLSTIESLCELRDYLEDLIFNWEEEDEDIELEDDDE